MDEDFSIDYYGFGSGGGYYSSSTKQSETSESITNLGRLTIELMQVKMGEAYSIDSIIEKLNGVNGDVSDEFKRMLIIDSALPDEEKTIVLFSI